MRAAALVNRAPCRIARGSKSEAVKVPSRYFFDGENMMFVVQISRDDDFSWLIFESGEIIPNLFARRKRNGGQIRAAFSAATSFTLTVGPW